MLFCSTPPLANGGRWILSMLPRFDSPSIELDRGAETASERAKKKPADGFGMHQSILFRSIGGLRGSHIHVSGWFVTLESFRTLKR